MCLPESPALQRRGQGSPQWGRREGRQCSKASKGSPVERGAREQGRHGEYPGQEGFGVRLRAQHCREERGWKEECLDGDLVDECQGEALPKGEGALGGDWAEGRGWDLQPGRRRGR